MTRAAQGSGDRPAWVWVSALPLTYLHFPVGSAKETTSQGR